jgi:anti-sigma regulatory factor (Ser/Thr protein kinase)
VSATGHRGTVDANGRFDHRAAVYASTAEMFEAVSPFILEGIDRRERVVLVMSDRQIGRTRATLGAAVDGAETISAEDLYAHPAQMYADYCAMLDAHTRSTTQPLRIIAEQTIVGRNAQGIAELRRIEAACNTTFAFANARILCLYDAVATPREALDGVPVTHRTVLTDGSTLASPDYIEPSRYLLDERRATRLPVPPARAVRLDPVESGRQAGRFAAMHAGRLDVRGRALDGLALAVAEVATNALINAVGVRLDVWREADRVVCQVSDAGYGLTDGLSGYRPPYRDRQGSGRLWTARLLCDTLDIATGDLGTTVRMTSPCHGIDPS